MASLRRTQAGSACAQPHPGGRPFHLFDGPEGNVRREIVDSAYAAASTDLAAIGVIGDVYGLLRAAGRGEMRGSRDLVPVRRFPTLWELRWSIRKVGEFRSYHAEAATEPALVSLRFHRKDTTGGDPDEVGHLQNAEIDEAARRHEVGASTAWGHTKHCLHCVEPSPPVG